MVLLVLVKTVALLDVFVSEKRSVWDHVLAQNLAELEDCSEEVVFPSRVV